MEICIHKNPYTRLTRRSMPLSEHNANSDPDIGVSTLFAISIAMPITQFRLIFSCDLMVSSRNKNVHCPCMPLSILVKRNRLILHD